MPNAEYASHHATVGDWKVVLVNDEDGHLGIFVAHASGDVPEPVGAEIGNENEWAERFTASSIEAQNDRSEDA